MTIARTDERDNDALFSYFNGVSIYPSAVMFSTLRRDSAKKDSTKMAPETGKFVANLVTEDLVEPTNRTSALLGAVSEFDFAGLKREAAVTVDATRVAAAACLECTIYVSIEVYDNVVTIGAVKHISIGEQITADGVIDMTNVDSVGRLGGPYYTQLDFLDVQRQNFGPWNNPIETGFAIDEDTGWLKVESESFRAVINAVRRLDDGEPVAEYAFDRDELASCYERRDLCLEWENRQRTNQGRACGSRVRPGFHPLNEASDSAVSRKCVANTRHEYGEGAREFAHKTGIVNNCFPTEEFHPGKAQRVRELEANPEK